MLDVDVAIRSTGYQAFIKAVCELQKVNIQQLIPSKRVAFFLNIYQCMYVHMFFKMVSEGHQAESECGMFQRLSSFMSSSKQKPFYYNIAGEEYTIDDIKHGMLRGNHAKPGHIMRVLSQSDAKTRILPRVSISKLRNNLSFLFLFSGFTATLASTLFAWIFPILWSISR